ncbi:MAG: dehydrogenase [Alphaproteobacteria bacterium]|nr:hypothetical protein [Pseudorhodoplanes sp.]MCQ3941921.1 dehydrogenase [Alphaproteobacteria bacterium]GIK81033.1 MAG: dehydrogenase [Alphaproteobacteria bacterium]
MTSNRGEHKAQALWYVAPGIAEIRSGVVAAPGPDEVRVVALHGAISRGTEALVMAGRVPPSEYGRMRPPFMGGDFPFPVKYGYATVGRIDAGPSEWLGLTVFALHPHQSMFVVPVERLIPVPERVPATRAVLAANMETALNAVWDGRPAPATRIAVVGAGVVGCLTAWLCGRIPGATVTLVDVMPARAAIAAALGVGFAAPGEAEGDCDFVFHASGQAAGLETAIGLAGLEASVIELSWYGAGTVPVSLGGAFHSRRLRLVSSQVGHVAPAQRARWTHRRRLEAAMDLLSDPVLDGLLAPAIRFHDLPARLPDVLAPGSGVLCQSIDY